MKYDRESPPYLYPPFDPDADPRMKPDDTDPRKERLRDTIYTVVAVLLFLLFIFFLVDGFNNIPMKGVHP